MNTAESIAQILGLRPRQVASTISLFDGGNTVPFIARYRKEQTGSLDETQLRAVRAQLERLRALESRREEVLRLLSEQGHLTESLESRIQAAKTVAEIDDVYRPFRPRRRTRATVARDRGLEPLADRLQAQVWSWHRLVTEAEHYVGSDREPATVEEALSGAADIVAERLADDPTIRARVRDLTWKQGFLTSTCKLTATEDGAFPRTNFEGYYQYSEPLAKVKSYAVLAVNRGETEEVLKVQTEAPVDTIQTWLERRLVKTADDQLRTFLRSMISDSYKRLLAPSLERELRGRLWEAAEEHAIQVFAANLRRLLLQRPVKEMTVLGIDPGYRTGCKLAVVDPTGRVIETGAIFPHPPQSQQTAGLSHLQTLIQRHHVNLIAIGNGTASRETEELVAHLLQGYDGTDQRPVYVIVSEAGASVYSASELARAELPGLDVSLRGAVSIARRVQDPLAELVKIDPRSIGVGLYQHDIDQNRLSGALSDVVESCVNQVGVDLNTASPALLSHVAGVSTTIAERIVGHRNTHGAYPDRKSLRDVRGLGPKTFEQCAGFLRVAHGNNPLDGTAVHPESYSVAQAIVSLAEASIEDLRSGTGRSSLQHKLNQLSVASVARTLGVGEPTASDIVAALARPGLDPRDAFPPPQFRRDILAIEDLQPGMTLGGVITNVVDFGAFVDIGFKRAGLIHVSQLSDGFVRHPLDVVEPGQHVTVEVRDVDLQRGRIALRLTT